MIRSLVPLKIRFKNNGDQKWRPKNMLPNTTYSVIAEQWKRRTQQTENGSKEVEELHLGFIGEDFSLTFVASFNCNVGEVDIDYEWEHFETTEKGMDTKK